MVTGKQLDLLRESFPADKVKTRPGGGGMTLDYVAIETVLERLLDVAPEYSWEGRVVSFDGSTAVVEGVLTVPVHQGNGVAVVEKKAYGVGAMKNPDPDMAVKSANSEAMKNAAKNGFGIALELWDAEHRKSLAKARKFQNASVDTLKAEVFRIAKSRLPQAKPTAKQIAALFDVEPADLSEESVLRQILEDEGVI